MHIQQFVVHLHQETTKTTNEMKLQDLTPGSVIKYTNGDEYIVSSGWTGFESYIDIVSIETDYVMPMHKLTRIDGKRWEIVSQF